MQSITPYDTGGTPPLIQEYCTGLVSPKDGTHISQLANPLWAPKKLRRFG